MAWIFASFLRVLILLLLPLALASWPTRLYACEIVEAFLRFLRINRAALSLGSPIQILGEKLVETLDDLALQLALRPKLKIPARVTYILCRLEGRLQQIDHDHGLKLVGLDQLLASLNGPFEEMLKATRPDLGTMDKVCKFFSYFTSRCCGPSDKDKKSNPDGPITLPRNGREFLFFPKTIPAGWWVSTVMEIVEPLSLILETARKLGFNDLKLIRKVYEEKFSEVYPEALELAKKYPVKIYSRMPNKYKLKVIGPPPSIPRKASAPVKSLRNATTKTDKSTPTKTTTTTTTAMPIDRSELLMYKRKLSDLWEELPFKGNDHRMMDIYGVPCYSKYFKEFIDTHVARPCIMDAFFAMFIKKRKNGRRIPADAWVSLKHEETEKVTSFYNRAKIYSSRHPLQIFFPISLGNSWILVLINMKINAPAQLSVYAPFIEKKGRVEEVVRAVINSITMFYSDKEPDGSDLEWKEVNMLTDLPGRHAKSMIESAGFIMSYVRDLGKLNNPTNWQVAAFQVAIEMLEPQRVSSTVYDEVDTLDDYSSE